MTPGSLVPSWASVTVHVELCMLPPCSLISSYLPKRHCRLTSYVKLPSGVNECANVCTHVALPAKPGCIPTFYPVFPGLYCLMYKIWFLFLHISKTVRKLGLQYRVMHSWNSWVWKAQGHNSVPSNYGIQTLNLSTSGYCAGVRIFPKSRSRLGLTWWLNG